MEGLECRWERQRGERESRTVPVGPLAQVGDGAPLGEGRTLGRDMDGLLELGVRWVAVDLHVQKDGPGVAATEEGPVAAVGRVTGRPSALGSDVGDATHGPVARVAVPAPVVRPVATLGPSNDGPGLLMVVAFIQPVPSPYSDPNGPTTLTAGTRPGPQG